MEEPQEPQLPLVSATENGDPGAAPTPTKAKPTMRSVLQMAAAKRNQQKLRLKTSSLDRKTYLLEEGKLSTRIASPSSSSGPSIARAAARKERLEKFATIGQMADERISRIPRKTSSKEDVKGSSSTAKAASGNTAPVSPAATAVIGQNGPGTTGTTTTTTTPTIPTSTGTAVPTVPTTTTPTSSVHHSPRGSGSRRTTVSHSSPRANATAEPKSSDDQLRKGKSPIKSSGSGSGSGTEKKTKPTRSLTLRNPKPKGTVADYRSGQDREHNAPPVIFRDINSMNSQQVKKGGAERAPPLPPVPSVPPPSGAVSTRVPPISVKESKAVISRTTPTKLSTKSTTGSKRNSAALTRSASSSSALDAPQPTKPRTSTSPRPRNASVGSKVVAPQKKQYPLTSPQTWLKEHKSELTAHEQSEIMEYPEVYFIGAQAKKIQPSRTAANNRGFDDDKGDYKAGLHDHLYYRYEILGLLGNGAFGRVVKVLDHKTQKHYALKIIRNRKRYHQQALVEHKILMYIKQKDPQGATNSVIMGDSFYFRNHICFTFELMSINLYDFIKANNFRGFSLKLIRKFAERILVSLRFLAKHHIIHCDLKPENILLNDHSKTDVTLIDFGSSCFEHEKIFTYIQSRFYRAPEIILGLPYGTSIDMWSFACILAELYLGYPLFPGENELDQLSCIMEIFGCPPEDLLEHATRKKYFFAANGRPRIIENSAGIKRTPNSAVLEDVMPSADPQFIDLIRSCLHWHPKERITPAQALQHPWILNKEPDSKEASPLNTSGTPTPESYDHKNQWEYLPNPPAKKTGAAASNGGAEYEGYGTWDYYGYNNGYGQDISIDSLIN